MNVAVLWLVLVAPLPYWALGLPWLDADRMRLAPLLGCAVAGALLPLALACYAVLITQLPPLGSEGTAALRRVCWLGAITGTAPWVLLNTGISAGLWLSAGLRQRFAVGSEGDYLRVLEHHLQPLGLTAFPALPCLSAVFLVASFWISAWSRNEGSRGIDSAGAS